MNESTIEKNRRKQQVFQLCHYLFIRFDFNAQDFILTQTFDAIKSRR